MERVGTKILKRGDMGSLSDEPKLYLVHESVEYLESCVKLVRISREGHNVGN